MSGGDDRFWYDEESAERAVRFFGQYLRHVKGAMAGEPFELADWQADEIVRPLFGWRRTDDGTRRYRTCYIEIARKNGKSTLAAGLALYLLLADGEPGPEVYSAAADRDQARLVFDIAAQMAEAHPALAQRTRLYRVGTLRAPQVNGVYRALSSESHTKHGLNAHGIIFDELHAQKDRELWDVLTTSVGARRQPLTIALTTAGYDRTSICWELHEYAEKVQSGAIDDPTFLPVLFAAAEDDDWTDRATWRKANPALGTAVSEEYLAARCAEARAVPARENTFRRLHLSQWTEQDTRWLSMESWRACERGEVTRGELVGQPCYVGLDLSSTTDVTAAVAWFPEQDACLARFWFPGANAELRERKDRVPLQAWAREGWLEFTDGNVVDYEAVRAALHEWAGTYEVRQVAVDRWNSHQLQQQLIDDGLDVAPFGQGFASMSDPTKQLEAAVLAGRVEHFGNPVLGWMVSNATVEQDPAGNLKPSKRKARDRIDGVVALIMAMGRAHADAEERGPSVYSGRGLRLI